MFVSRKSTEIEITTEEAVLTEVGSFYIYASSFGNLIFSRVKVNRYKIQIFYTHF